MKIYAKSIEDLIRVSFGYNKSITFKEATVYEVWDLMMKVFKEVRVTKTFELKNQSVFDSPAKTLTLIITARQEGSKFNSSHHKGLSKSKTIYGLTGDEAMKIFLDNYEKHLP